MKNCSQDHIFNVSVTNLTLNINTTTPQHTYQKAGIKINTPGYSIANSGTGCTPISNGFCVFSVSDVSKAVINLSGPAGVVTFTLCLNASGKLSCQNFNASIIIPYIADNNGFVWQCALNGTGLFAANSCTQLTPNFSPNTPWTGPTGVTTAFVNGIPYAYVSDGSGTGNVYKCAINPNGAFPTCSIVPASGISPSWQAFDVQLHTTNGTQYAYVTDGNGGAFKCSLNPDGTFTANSCVQLNPSFNPTEPWTGTIGITFQTVNGKTYAYVADADGTGNVYQCGIKPDGTFSTCSFTPSAGTLPDWEPSEVAFARSGGVLYAYVADNTGFVWQCALNQTGLFAENSCIKLTPNFGTDTPWVGPTGVITITVNGIQYAYVADGCNGTGNVYQCRINQNGTFSTCSITPSSGNLPNWNAWTVDFNQ